MVDGAAKIAVMFHDGTRVPAELIGSDRETDRALLHVVLPKGQHNHAQLGDSDKLEVGQKVLAIGHPFGLAYALANVVISGLGKLAETNQDVFHERIIQTTAPINPGNSGGPLTDSADQVIGINTVILMGAENIARNPDQYRQVNCYRLAGQQSSDQAVARRQRQICDGGVAESHGSSLVQRIAYHGCRRWEPGRKDRAPDRSTECDDRGRTVGAGSRYSYGGQWADGDEYGTIYESVAGASSRSDDLDDGVQRRSVSRYERQARGMSNGAQSTTPPQNPGASVCPASFTPAGF